MSFSEELTRALQMDAEIWALAEKRARANARVIYDIRVTKIDVKHAEQPAHCKHRLLCSFVFPLCQRGSLTQQVIANEITKESFTKELGHAFNIGIVMSVKPPNGRNASQKFLAISGMLDKHDETTFKLYSEYKEDGEFQVQLEFAKRDAISAITVLHDPNAHQRIFQQVLEEAIEFEVARIHNALDRVSALTTSPTTSESNGKKRARAEDATDDLATE